MKKFLLKTVLFFILVMVIDFLCGWSFDWLRNKAHGGPTMKSQYISNQCEDDILILGSSKAAHHYVPQIISDSIGLSCYNCGQEGNGIVAAYARYKMVTARKKPKMVIYEITPRYDYLEDNGYDSYLGAIRQYTDNIDVRQTYFAFSDRLERLRLLSNMYCNNSRLISVLRDCVKATPNRLGYEPLYGKISLSQRKPDYNNTKSLDSLKYEYMEKLIQSVKDDGVKLVFVISPMFETSNISGDYTAAHDLSEKYGVPLINNIECIAISGNVELFQDYTHLNNTGAMEYSKIVAHQLKQLED